MIIKSKIKTKIAFISAMAIFLSNTASSFAGYVSYEFGEDIREKALSRYLLSESVMVAEQARDLSGVTYNEKSEDAVVTEIEETEEIAFNTVKRANYSLEKGTTVTVREGVPGQTVKRYRVKYFGGVETERTLISESVSLQPVDKIVEYGNMEETSSVSDTGFSYKAVYVFEATAYDMSPEENGGYGGMTATGVPLDVGIVAVDPKVIPLGSRVYIEALDGSWSYGYALAADTGGAIKGNRVDLCYRTRSECIQFGRRKCRIYVLS